MPIYQKGTYMHDISQLNLFDSGLDCPHELVSQHGTSSKACMLYEETAPDVICRQRVDLTSHEAATCQTGGARTENVSHVVLPPISEGSISSETGLYDRSINVVVVRSLVIWRFLSFFFFFNQTQFAHRVDRAKHPEVRVLFCMGYCCTAMSITLL